MLEEHQNEFTVVFESITKIKLSEPRLQRIEF